MIRKWRERREEVNGIERIWGERIKEYQWKEKRDWALGSKVVESDEVNDVE